MHPFTYLLAFSRLAPVQLASWGHPVTTGIPAIDCFVSHALCEDGDTAAQYSERLLQMPAAVPYTRYRRPSYPGRRRERQDFGLPDARTLYLVPHALFKLTPDFVAVLRALLAADPGALFVFAGPAPRAWCDVVRGRLAPMGTTANLRFLGALSPGDFLELLRLGDVLLDSFHFGGGNTTAEALFAGTPIVTLPGRLMRGRFTYAWLRHAGVDDGIAQSADDYVARALRFGGDAELRRHVRARTLAAAEAIDADARPVAAFAAALRAALVDGQRRN
jgi:predicted O-linked N-acetylglucosamine transferase (SPINDLY family)